MKSLLYPLLCLFFVFSANAATSITTPSVSGHWTLSGSPYNIYNDITIPAGYALQVDPGVEVVFQGFYSMKVSGNLLSVGTSAQPIKYYVADTTGRHFNNNTHGGWGGIIFLHSPASAFEYCHVSGMKPTYDTGYGFNVVSHMRIANCKFYNNILNVDWGTAAHSLNGIIRFANGTIQMDSCEIFNNTSGWYTLRIDNFTHAPITIQNCDIHHNDSYEKPGLGASIGVAGSVTFINNDVHNELCSDGTFMSHTASPGKVVISKNRFYSNKNKENAAINCNGGSPLIENNFVCNNTNDSNWCGLTSGGGGIHIYSNGPDDTTKMIIRNNVIANNFSANQGGAIYAFECNAVIVNNQIINNESTSYGAAIAARIGSHRKHTMIIKNNILYGNFNPYVTGPSDISIFAYSKCKLEYSHNWAERSFAANMPSVFSLDSLIWTDSTGNIIGTNPGMVLPTTSHSVLENALSSNFNLLSTSPCINKGAASSYSGSVDYANNLRTAGGYIDIGAYEYGSNANSTPVVVNEALNVINVYPNPVSSVAYVTTPVPSGLLSLLDISGRLLAEKTVTALTTSFDLQSFLNGIYIIKWSAEGHTTELKKIVVE